MAHFPGIAMIIDDQFNLVNSPEPEEPELKVQYNSLNDIKNFLENNTIPFVSIHQTQDLMLIRKKIGGYDNVRLLILDLDLNNDGHVGDEDDVPIIISILGDAVKKYGYFYLLINSAHSERWEQIKEELPGDISVLKKKNNSVSSYDKHAGNLPDVLLSLQVNNFSLELVYDFECALNKARDKAFSGLIDYEKRTWNRIYSQIILETSGQSNFILSSAYLSVLKQFMLDAHYSVPEHTDPIDSELAKSAFNLVNYIGNNEDALSGHPIWTGNLYEIDEPKIENVHYALIVTPECDIAQRKVINYQIVYGYEINEVTFPEDYDHMKYTTERPPVHPFKSGMAKGKWRDKANLKDTKGFIEHLYPMPFVSKNGKTIILDFRDITYASEDEIAKWSLHKRINDPMITDILDKISMIFNRKGLLPLLPSTVKVI